MVAPLRTSTAQHVAFVTSWDHLPLHIRPATPLDDEALWELCVANPDLRIERTAHGELVIMPPTGGETGIRNARLTAQLVVWADRDGTGIAFDSSAGFLLANGAERAPDAAWVRRSRWDALTREQQRRLVPLCPDFVLELMSPSDSLREQQDKLEEYIANGARLGWLIDPVRAQVHVYRPSRAPDVLARPAELTGDPELPGLVVDLGLVW